MIKLRALILTSLLVTTMASTTYAGTENIKVTIDGQAVEFTDATPYVDNNGRTMMPVAKIGALLNVQVGWYADIETVILKGNGKEVKLKLNDDSITINDVTSKMDTKAVTKNGRTYVPVSAIAKAFGVTTSWDKATNTVKLQSPPDVPEILKDTVTNGDITLSAELKGNNKILTFQAASSVPVQFYFVIGKSEYMEANDYTVEELKNEADTATYNLDGHFQTDNLNGSCFDKYYISTKSTVFPPAYGRVGERYTAKVFGVTESGETTGVATLEFKLAVDTTNSSTVRNEDNSITATLVKNNKGLTYNVNTSEDVNFYFLTGKKEYLQANDFTAEELKEIGDNVNKDQWGRFTTDDLFGVVSVEAYDGSTTGYLLPENAEIGAEYTTKIFGVTASGEITGVVSLDVILK